MRLTACLTAAVAHKLKTNEWTGMEVFLQCPTDWPCWVEQRKLSSWSSRCSSVSTLTHILMQVTKLFNSSTIFWVNSSLFRSTHPFYSQLSLPPVQPQDSFIGTTSDSQFWLHNVHRSFKFLNHTVESGIFFNHLKSSPNHISLCLQAELTHFSVLQACFGSSIDDLRHSITAEGVPSAALSKIPAQL